MMPTGQKVQDLQEKGVKLNSTDNLNNIYIDRLNSSYFVPNLNLLFNLKFI